MSKLAQCPHCGGDLAGQLDGRAGWWQFRVRLYDMEVNPDEPMADSDSDLLPDKPGATKVRGLWKVLSEAAICATEWHGGATLRGFSVEDQERKLRGIRPTLSRNGGRACIRVEYDTTDSFRPEPADRKPRYLARVDLVKSDGGDNGAV